MVFCQHAMGNEKKSTVYRTEDEGCGKQSRCGQVHQDDKEILQCVRDEDPWKRGKTRQKAISPLHDPGKDNVKQSKTNEDKNEGKRQLRKKVDGREGYIRVMTAVATATES